jgi:glutamate racemase
MEVCVVKIGVFDSGVGGLSVANAIKKALPEHEVILREDKEHVPYGMRSPQEILSFVIPIFRDLIDEGCQIIVVACNTVSTTLIKDLRHKFAVPLIAVEPMVKTAAKLTETKTIVVCATPITLTSKRYTWLKRKYAKELIVLEPDCSDWALMIEQHDIDQRKIAELINQSLDVAADVIVLGCTHYHWIENEIKKLAAGRAKVLQPEQAIIQRLKHILTELN